MATELEDLALMRSVERVIDKLWDVVAGWEEFAKDTIGKQLVRAADSIGANVSEGYGRFNYGEKIQFLYYARGSLFETKFWLNRAVARKLITHDDHTTYAAHLTEIARQINNFVGYLKTQRNPGSQKIKAIREDTAPYSVDRLEETSDCIFTVSDLDMLHHF